MPPNPIPIVRGLWANKNGQRVLALHMPGLVVGTAQAEGTSWAWKVAAGSISFGEQAASWEDAREAVERAVMTMIRKDKRKNPSWRRAWKT